MTEVKRIWYCRSCANTKVELRRFRDFIQVHYNGKQIAVFHIKAVQSLIGERREDEDNTD